MINYPDSSEYEQSDIYSRRSQILDERRSLIQAERESRRRARDLSLRIRRGELEQELAPYNPPQPIEPRQLEPPNPVLGAILQGLEYINRPGQAVKSAFAAPFYGANPLESALRGLQGMSIAPGTEDTAEAASTILERKFGMGAGPSMGPINARGALGLGIDFALDPLSYVQIGNIAKAKKGADLLAKVGPTAPLTVAQQLEKIKPNPIVSAVQGIPKVGRAAVEPVNLIDPRMINNPESKKVIIAWRARYEEIKNESSRRFSILKGEVEEPFERVPLEKGQKEGINTLWNIPGRAEPMPTGDVMQSIDIIKSKYGPIAPKQEKYFQNVDEFMADSKDFARKNGIEFDETRLPAPGSKYFPREDITKPETILPKKRPVGAVIQSQKKRGYITEEAGIKKGEQYTGDPLQVAVNFRAAVERRVADQDMINLLVEKGIAKKYDTQLVEETKRMVKEAQAHATQADELRGLVGQQRSMLGVPGLGTQIVDESLLAKLEAKFPDLARDLRQAVDSGDTGELSGLWVRAGGLIDEAKATAKSVAADYQAIKSGQKKLVEGMVPIPDKLFKGLWFKPEEGQQIYKLVSEKANVIPAGLRDLAAVPRVLATTLDFAYGMLQGLPIAVMNPTAWAKIMQESFKTFLDKNNLYRYVAKEKATFEAVPNLAMANPEFMPESAGTLSGIFKNIPLFDRFQASFEAGGLVARAEMAKTFAPMYQKAGRPLTDLGDFVNRATGVYNSRATGMSPTQQALEAAGLFAPSYTRASLAAVGYALDPTNGVQGKAARQMLLNMMVVGPAMYTKMATMMGQKPQLNPSDPRFLSVQLGTEWIGVGTIWVAMARLVTRSLAHPEGLLTDNELEPNPLLRFWRSRASPTASMIWDVIDGKTYLGADLVSPVDFGKAAVSKFVPMTLDSFLLQNPPASPSALLPMLIGARTFPISQGERLDIVAKKDYAGRSFKELSPLEQVEVRKDPSLQAGRDIGGIIGKEIKDKEQIFTEYNQSLEQAAQAVTQGTMTHKQFRDRQSRLAQQRSDLLDSIEKRYPEGKSRELDPREIEYKKYISLFDQQDPVTGQIDFDAAEEYLLSLDPSLQKYIEEKQRAGMEQLPESAKQLMQELYQDRRKARPYWDVWRETMQKYDLYDIWRRMNGPQQELMKETPQYKRVSSFTRQAKQKLRRQRPDIDAVLNKWGYVSAPVK